jgi:hypothetical protein
MAIVFLAGPLSGLIVQPMIGVPTRLTILQGLKSLVGQGYSQTIQHRGLEDDDHSLLLVQSCVALQHFSWDLQDR